MPFSCRFSAILHAPIEMRIIAPRATSFNTVRRMSVSNRSSSSHLVAAYRLDCKSEGQFRIIFQSHIPVSGENDAAT